MGPLLREVTLLSLYSVLKKDTFKTNKHNHFSEIKGWVSRNDNENIKRIKTLDFWQKDGTSTDASWTAY